MTEDNIDIITRTIQNDEELSELYKTDPNYAIELANEKLEKQRMIEEQVRMNNEEIHAKNISLEWEKLEERHNNQLELDDLREKLKLLDEKGDSYGYGIIKNWIELKEIEANLIGTDSEQLQKIRDEEAKIEQEYHEYVEDLKEIEEMMAQIEKRFTEDAPKRTEEEKHSQEIEIAEEERLIRESSFDSGSGPKM